MPYDKFTQPNFYAAIMLDAATVFSFMCLKLKCMGNKHKLSHCLLSSIHCRYWAQWCAVQPIVNWDAQYPDILANLVRLTKKVTENAQTH